IGPINSTQMINNDYSKLKIIDTLFNFGLVVDQILGHSFLQAVPAKERNMAKGIYELALHLNWTKDTVDEDPGEFVAKIKPYPNNATPDQVLPDRLSGNGS